MVDMTHERAVLVVRLWLEAKKKTIAIGNKVHFTTDFIYKHQLGTRSRPNTEHSFDIVTADNIYIELDDYGKHSHKSQKINDGIINDYAENYLIPNGCQFYRLLKEEIVDSKGYLQPTAAEYLKKNLF